MNDRLDARMIAAHEAGDAPALIALYTEAADTTDDVDAHCFFLTHAYIFALEAGAPEVSALHSRLKSLGREE